MTSAFNANPPNYEESSVVDDISSLISTALAVQESLFNAKERLSRIDTTDVNNLLPRLVHIDEGYLDLLDESRTSASELNIAIHGFLEVAIPISLDFNNPMEDRAGIAREFADKISISGKKDFRYYDRKVEALKRDLNQLLADLTSLERQQRSTTLDKTLLRDIQTLVELFSELPGKLGHFDAIWKKLNADASELNVFLNQGSSEQDLLGNRVQAEVGVYEQIMQALDDYCLRTRR